MDSIINEITIYFREKVFDKHIYNVVKKHSKLKEYNINPILVKYLSKVLVDNYSPEGVARALYYPRVLGTSINTSFGSVLQNMLVDLGLASGSMIPGMDIEFVDKIDGRKKWCQIKAGPNTINSKDVAPMIEEFSKTIRLAKTNNAFKGISNNDFIVGVLYGKESQLSQHYKKINSIHPVYTGTIFWHRLTGHSDFYDKLVIALHLTIENLEANDFFVAGLNQLTEEIRVSNLFDFSLS